MAVGGGRESMASGGQLIEPPSLSRLSWPCNYHLTLNAGSRDECLILVYVYLGELARYPGFCAMQLSHTIRNQ